MENIGPKRDKVMGGCRKLYSEKPYDLHSSPSIIIFIKSRKMRLAGHTTGIGETRNCYRLPVRKRD
jgi:hypothetical protein